MTDGYSQVKGESFNSWRTVGSVVASAKVFAKRDVDELMLLDVKARSNGTKIDKHLVANLADFLRVPFAVGGGINSMNDIEDLLTMGADKVVIGTSLFENSKLISSAANTFGSQAIVCSIDFAKINGTYYSFIQSGMKKLEIHPIELALRAQELGAGEILLQNVPSDGTLKDINTDLVFALHEKLKIPLIASGGVGKVEDFEMLFSAGASAVAAGAIFQFTQITPKEVRKYLDEKGFPVRRF